VNIKFQKVKPTLYLLLWIFLVFIAWFLWLLGIENLINVGDYIFVTLFGIFVGIVSGLSPKRVFLVCFLGFFIIAPSGFFFSIFEDLVFLGVLCGVFGMAGAVIRRVTLKKGIEDLYLKPWEWALLIGGISILADYIVIPCASAELFTYHRFTNVSRFFICSLIGLFALGVYAGVFYSRDYESLLKSVGKMSFGGHCIFFVYRGYLLALGYITWKSFLLISFAIIFLGILLFGVKIGYRYRGYNGLQQQ
jgi:hypothetical protein